MSEIPATKGAIGRLKARVNKLENKADVIGLSSPITQSDVTGLTGYYAASSPAPLTSPIQQSNVTGLTGYYAPSSPAPLTSPIVQGDVTGLTGYYQSSTAAMSQSRITGLTGYYAASSPTPLTSPIIQADVTGLTGYYQSSTANLTQSRITGLTGYYAASSPAPLTSPIVQSDVTGLTGYYQSSTAAMPQSRITGLTGYYAASSPAPLTSPIVQSDVTGLTGYYQSSTADLTQSRITGLTGYYASSTTLTTKGDVLTYGTGLVRLAVGSNDQVLTADSAQAAGIKWAAAGGGADKIFYYSRTATNAAFSSNTASDVLIGGTSMSITPAAVETWLITYQLHGKDNEEGFADDDSYNEYSLYYDSSRVNHIGSSMSGAANGNTVGFAPAIGTGIYYLPSVTAAAHTLDVRSKARDTNHTIEFPAGLVSITILRKQE